LTLHCKGLPVSDKSDSHYWLFGLRRDAVYEKAYSKSTKKDYANSSSSVSNDAPLQVFTTTQVDVIKKDWKAMPSNQF
jgi:hypothetical protein